jgi:Uma2 family endonuclease
MKEYWIVQPQDRTVTIHTLSSEGKFQPLKMRTIGEKLESPLFPGLTVDLDETFKTQVWEEEPEYGNRVVRI